MIHASSIKLELPTMAECHWDTPPVPSPLYVCWPPEADDSFNVRGEGQTKKEAYVDLCENLLEYHIDSLTDAEIEGWQMVIEELKEELGMEARWAESAGGVCLEVKNPPDHFCDPGGWRILAFITPNPRRTGFIAELNGRGVGLDFQFGHGSYRTLEDAKAALVRATGLEISDYSEDR
jgi:hypothetical protein